MENRRPGPEDTENSTSTDSSKADKAEGVIAWFTHQLDNEHHMMLASKSEKRGSKEEDEEDDDDEDDFGVAKTHHLKLGGFTIQTGNEKAASTSEFHEAEESSDEISQDTADFEQWEQEVAATSTEVGSADMQMAESDLLVGEPHAEKQHEMPIEAEPEEESQPDAQAQKVGKHSSNHHQSRTSQAGTARTNLSQTAQPDVPKPPAAAGGGGGEVPPTDRAESAADLPDEPFENSQNTVFNVYDTLIDRSHTDALTDTSPNKIADHEHRHTHVGMGILMAAGLLAERMSRRGADKRNEKASRKRDDKLREQIEDTRAMHEQTRQKLESRQRQLTEAQDRQQQVLEHIRPTVNNIERTVAPGRSERPEPMIETVQAQTAAELHQHIEQGALPAPDAEAKIRSKIVMEQIATAAENSEPVERVYERRQEVKDEPGTPAGAASGGAASIGSLITKHHSTQQYAGKDTRDSSSRQSDASSSHGAGIDYRAAAIRGVGAGLAVIVLALLAYALL